MEHRCSIRISIEFDAVVNCRRVGVVHGTIRDVGLGGMFVETGSIALCMNTPVDVIMRVPENGADRLYRLRAWVVWAGQRGAGLMLRSIDDATNIVLRKLVTGNCPFSTAAAAAASAQAHAAEPAGLGLAMERRAIPVRRKNLRLPHSMIVSAGSTGKLVRVG
jgi:hypothetical protein